LMGRSSVEYPPRASDLNTLEFYLWGPLKDVTSLRKPPTLETLREEIEKSYAAVPVGTLAMVTRALVRQN
jgi:hypothetical protein